MKSQLPHIDLLQEHELAQDSAQETLASLRDCSLAPPKRDCLTGTGVPFVKMGQLVRYHKNDICE